MEKSSHLIRKLIILVCILLPTFSFAATTYKYSGEHGETVYSQSPPRNSKAERVTIKSRHNTNPSRTSAVETLEKFTRDNDDKQRAMDKAAEEKERFAIKKKNCAIAKQNLASYEASARRLIKDSSGNYKRLTGEEREAQIKTARENIKKFCN